MPKLVIREEDFSPKQFNQIQHLIFELKDLKHRIRRLPKTSKTQQLIQDYHLLQQACIDQIEEIAVDNLIPTEKTLYTKLQTARKSTGGYKPPLKRIARPATLSGRIEEATRQQLHYTINLSVVSDLHINRIQFFLPQSTLDTTGTLYIPYDPFPDQIKNVHSLLSSYSPIPSFVRHQRA